MKDVNYQGPPADEIKNLFDSISHGYDLANDLMTGGLARGWRKRLVQWSEASPGDKVLDCATGTGDLAIEFKKKVGPSGYVKGTDFSKGMLAKAPVKAKKLNLEIDFEWADATELPYVDNQFTITSIAYGIRNVNDPIRALSEMARVTKPGGRVMILETGDHQSPVIQRVYRWYFKNVVPRLGALTTGKKDAYEYLQKSSSCFPSQGKFLDLMRATERFSSVECRPLFAGASFLYKGVVKV